MLSPIAKGISMSTATSDVLFARGQLLCWCFCIRQLIDHVSSNHKSKETRHHSRHHFMSMHVTTDELTGKRTDCCCQNSRQCSVMSQATLDVLNCYWSVIVFFAICVPRQLIAHVNLNHHRGKETRYLPRIHLFFCKLQLFPQTQ